MNGHNTHILRTASVFLLSLLLTTCGSAGSTGSNNSTGAGSSTGPVLQITSPTQGAQAATAGIDAARDAAAFGIKLSTMAGQAAAAISTLPGLGIIPLTFDCTSRLPVFLGNTSTPNSVTVTKSGNILTAFFNTCRSGSTMTDGSMTVDLSGGTILAFTLGSDAAPMTVTDFETAASSVVIGTFKASAALSYGTSGGTDTLIVSGWTEHWDYVRHVHDRYDLANVFLTVTKTITTIGVDAYDMATLAIQGAMTKTASVSDTDPTVNYTESIVMTNFTVVDKIPAAGSAAVYEYLSLNGDISIATVPPGRCIDGAFSVVTGTELQVDRASGMVVSGQLTVNSTAVATFNADGSVTAAVSGGAPATFTRPELAAICAL
ncbi:MAG: hypothetical protein ACYC7L_02990 [Nitrospirota bacterium]